MGNSRKSSLLGIKNTKIRKRGKGDYKIFRALSPGDVVKHKAWGAGEVMTVSGQGDQTVAVISFYSAGEKNILLSMVPLEATGRNSYNEEPF